MNDLDAQVEALVTSHTRIINKVPGQFEYTFWQNSKGWHLLIGTERSQWVYITYSEDATLNEVQIKDQTGVAMVMIP